MQNTILFSPLNHFPNKRFVKKMGLSGDQNGIMQRYINEEGGWDSHLKNTKDYIISIVQKKKPRVVSIYGSGWLLDVPIDYLMENCEKTILYDIRHPRPILNRFRKNPQIDFVTADITGGYIEYVYRAIKEKKISALENLPETTLPTNINSDYSFSVNLLNQLDILLVEFINKQKVFGKEEMYQFRKTVQSNHIIGLPKGSSSIITDFEELLFNRTGELIEKRPLIFTDLPEKNKQWVWKFDSKMLYYPNRITHFNVLATEL